MNVKVKGEYCFSIPLQTMFLNETILFKGENLITFRGECFFMNRWVNDEFTPIQYIVLGKGTSRPVKGDKSLGRQTVQKQCRASVYPDTGMVVLSCDVSASEILDVTEIGVSNDEFLISHDVFKPITSEILLNDTTSSVHIDYTFKLTTGNLRTNWLASTEGNNIYYIYEPNTVVGVFENNTQSGYTQKNSVEELKNDTGTYYYNKNSKNLYIHNTRDSDPNMDEIIVQTR